MIAPKYRTDAQACSCPGYWYRRTCRHYRAYRDAVSLVQAQDVFNQAWSPIVDRLSGMGRWVRGPLPAGKPAQPGSVALPFSVKGVFCE